MIRSDFELITRVLRGARHSDTERVIDELSYRLARELSKTDPEFDEDKFIHATDESTAINAVIEE